MGTSGVQRGFCAALCGASSSSTADPQTSTSHLSNARRCMDATDAECTGSTLGALFWRTSNVRFVITSVICASLYFTVVPACAMRFVSRQPGQATAEDDRRDADPSE
eukprot:3295214-Rhodomonas_salina.5